MTPSQREKLLTQIARVVKQSRTFFLSGHERPDGDTVASEIAVGSLLKRLKKQVDIYNAEPVPPSLRFLAGSETIRTAKKVDKNYDVAMIFECFDGNRMGNIIDLKKQAKHVINIDHHLMHSNFGTINFVNVLASSNSEQLVYLFEKLKMPITQAEAMALYTGIATDTGRFQHSNTNAETFRIAGKLVERGANPALISERVFTTRNHSGIKLLGHVLTELQIIEQGKIAYAAITREDFRKMGSSEDDVEDIVNYGLQVPTVLVSILVRESENGGGVKVSLRSRRNVDVCKLARIFGGGGHKYASGCKIKGSVREVTQKIIESARTIL